MQKKLSLKRVPHPIYVMISQDCACMAVVCCAT